MDRDGTLIEHEPYLHDPANVRLLPGTIEGLRLAKDAGYLIFLFTNQSGVGRGYFSLDDVTRVNRRMIELIGLGPLFTDVCIAPESPGTFSRYRKPSPQFINETVNTFQISLDQSWMIGDSKTDWEAGSAAGINVAAINPSSPCCNYSSRRAASEVLVFPSMFDLVNHILLISSH